MAGGDVGGNKGKVSIYIDMTPMVDVIILLLIFFFMTSQFKEPAAVEINLPKPGKQSNVKVPISNTLLINVEADGNVRMKAGYADEVDVDVNKLRDEIAKRQAKNENLITILTVSPEARYSDMMDVLDEFKMASEETGNRKFSLQMEQQPAEGEGEEGAPAEGGE